MEFTVPQFIEKEARIVGPFTFKQFIFIGTAGGICLLLFFVVPLVFFVPLAVILLGGAFALAFLKVERTSLPMFIKNFFLFIFKPKIYLWQKKSAPPTILKQEKEVIKKTEEGAKVESTLKVVRGSKLRELFTYLETKQR